jgi:hypothetical protein
MAGRWAGAGRRGRCIRRWCTMYRVSCDVYRPYIDHRRYLVATVLGGHRRRSRARQRARPSQSTRRSQACHRIYTIVSAYYSPIQLAWTRMNLGVLRHVRIRTIELFCLLCWQQTRASEPRNFIQSTRLHLDILFLSNRPRLALSRHGSGQWGQKASHAVPCICRPSHRLLRRTQKYDLIYPIMATSAAYVALTCFCYQRPLQTPRNGRRGPGLAGRRFALGVRSGARQAGAGRPAGWR